MPDANDPSDALHSIAILADKAMAEPSLPAPLKQLLAEIRRLAVRQGGDTPEPSDLPRTENQSL